MIHVHVTIVTKLNVFSNNRGDSEGSNRSPLQKITVGNRLHTTHSAETIKYAMRAALPQFVDPGAVNRTVVEGLGSVYHAFKALDDPRKFFDSDVFGFLATKSKKEADEEAKPDEAGKKPKNPKGSATTRRARLEMSRAVSVDPFTNDVSFNVRGRMGGGDDPTPFQVEIHATRMQFSASMTPEGFEDPRRAHVVLLMLANIPGVGGAQARFMNDYSPENVVVRVTHDIPNGVMGVFQYEEGVPSCPSLVRAVEVGDVKASEMVVGGTIADALDGDTLRRAGAHVYRGINAAMAKVSGMLVEAGVKA